jgi:hypothetical protein
VIIFKLLGIFPITMTALIWETVPSSISRRILVDIRPPPASELTRMSISLGLESSP